MANLVGKYFEDKKTLKPFTYAFATPNTTTSVKADEYKTIFNVVNEDDMVPYMPLQKWGFRKYGTVRDISINENYEAGPFDINPAEGTFEWFIKKDYNNNGLKKDTLEMLGHIANSREELYIFNNGFDGKVATGKYTREDKAEEELRKLTDELREEKLLRFSNMRVVNVNLGDVIFYEIEVKYCPAFLTQTIANMASKKGSLEGRRLSGKYEDAKWSFIFSSGEVFSGIHVGGMYHPHMPLTYYLIVRNNFKDLN